MSLKVYSCKIIIVDVQCDLHLAVDKTDTMKMIRQLLVPD